MLCPAIHSSGSCSHGEMYAATADSRLSRLIREQHGVDLIIDRDSEEPVDPCMPVTDYMTKHLLPGGLPANYCPLNESYLVLYQQTSDI